ncbi:MAG TPA: hypothetical protein VGA56_25600 [Opitutaceae bacterium]
MKRNILTTAIIIILLSAAPAAADGPPPDALAPLPPETGEEICSGKLESCEAGLESCGEDRNAWQQVARDIGARCEGTAPDASLEDLQKVVRKKADEPPKKKQTRRRKVMKKRTPKKAPEPAPGPQGPQGERGADGVDGKDGHSIVWSLRRMPAGKTCANGGYLMMFGLDSNDDGTLDPTEAADLMAVCHGRDGKDGKDGKDGRDGDDGVRPTVGVGTFANALYARGRPDSFALFATASLGWPLNDSVSLTLEGGAAPGLDAAMMLRFGLDWRLGAASGLKIGGLYEVVGLTDNNFTNDQFVAATVGVYKDLSLHRGDSVHLVLRGEVSGILGVDAFINSDRKARIAGGVGGGLGLRLEF